MPVEQPPAPAAPMSDAELAEADALADDANEADVAPPTLKPSVVTPVDAPAGSVAMGERLVGQTKSAAKWRSSVPTGAEERHSSRAQALHKGFYSGGEHYDDPHPGAYPKVGDTVMYVANKLIGKSRIANDTPLNHLDLYSSYKSTPHAPSSMFLKYLVHRINHVEDYENHAHGHQLDVAFQNLVTKGDAARKNSHVSIADLHEWIQRHATTVVPQLLAEKARVQMDVARGIGLNTRSINGEPYVALTRGLNSDIMEDEPPLSSHADTPDTGFGDNMHHSWVPLKDLWFAYDLDRTRRSHNSMGPEDEYLVSNTGTRYEAAPHDVKKSRVKQWLEENPYVYDDMSDESLAGLLDKVQQSNAVQDADVIDAVKKHPNAGPAVYAAMQRMWAGRGFLGGFDTSESPPIGSFAHKWYPREAVMAAAARPNAQVNSPSWFRNPNLTSQDLETLAPKLFAQDSSKNLPSDSANALLSHPAMNSHLLEKMWRAQHGSPWMVRLLMSPLATHQMREDAVQVAKFNPFSETETPRRLMRAVTENPHHTEEQARGAYEWAVGQGLYTARPLEASHLARVLDGAKLPADIVSGLYDRDRELVEKKATRGALTPEEDIEDGTLYSLLGEYETRNPHSAPNLAVEAARHPGSISPTRLASRIDNWEGLEPELQAVLINEAQRIVANDNKAPGFGRQQATDYLEKLASSKKLSQESINYLAHYPGDMVRDVLFRNKDVTPEQIREAYPKSLPFPEPTGAGWSPPAAPAIADEIAMAYRRRKAYDEKKARQHFIKPLPQNLAKSSSEDMWRAMARGWLADQSTDGFYAIIHKDVADGAIRDMAIEPQFTDEVLDGEAVFARPATPENLSKLQTEAGPDDVVLYFETEVEPQQHTDGSLYWTSRVPCETVHVADVGHEPLAKMHTPLTFPKLGVGDDRRETKLVSNPRQRKTFFRAVAAQDVREGYVNNDKSKGDINQEMARNPRLREALMDRSVKIASKADAAGVMHDGIAGVGHPGWGLSREDRESVPGAGTGQSALSAAFTPSATPRRKSNPAGDAAYSVPSYFPQIVHHEDLHRVFARIQHKHGEKEKEMLARNLIHVLPQDLQSAVMKHLYYAQPHYQKSLNPEEEAITELTSYLNAAPVRDAFHRKQQHSPEQQRAFHDKMKRAYRLLLAVSPTVDENWLHHEKPWMHHGKAMRKFTEPQSGTGLSAAEAHEVLKGSNKLAKSHPDLVEDANAFAFKFETDPALMDAIDERHWELGLRKMSSLDEYPAAATNFMKEFTKQTVHNGFDDRLGRYHNTTGDNTEGTLIVMSPRVKAWSDKPTVALDWIKALKPGNGDGHRSMKFITDLADKHGVSIELHVGNEGAGGFKTSPKPMLHKFYKKHGFTKRGKFEKDILVRHTASHPVVEQGETLKLGSAMRTIKKAEELEKAGEPGYLDDNRPLWWHGTPSGDLKGGVTGLHVGSRKAAEDALHSRIGIPAEGAWDGTREYGKTLLAGQKSLRARGVYPTGYNSTAPEEDHYPTGDAQFSDGTPVLPTHKPSVLKLRITGKMSNTWRSPHQDYAANGRMASLLRRGSAKSGYYYRNEGEDAGSISAALPGPSHVTLGGWDVKKSEEHVDITLPHEKVLGPGEESAAKAMLGHNKAHETALAAARFLVSRKEQVDEDMFRVALSVFDGDHERAALIAVGLTDSEANLKALRAVLKLGEFSHEESSLSKNEPGTPHIETVNPGAPDAADTADEVKRGVTAGLVQPLKLGGKHSKGSMAVRDPKTGDVWLLKPGSGKQSPAAGARDDASSQSAREAAFWHCADRAGLGNYYPKADLLEVNGGQVAAMKLLGTQWKSLDERNRQVDGYAREVLQTYLDRGDVHRLAALDWILGNPDSHGQNVMVHAEAVALIDHGSAFAGPNFAPGKDTKSFTPYYLRVFAPSGYSKKKPEDRVRGLPRLNPSGDMAFKKWVQDIDPALLSETMGSHGIGQVAQEAVLARLSDLQHHGGPSLSEYLNGLWAGL